MVDAQVKETCCGCSACANICPKHCIQMREDVEGFLYPNVKTDNCIGCNLCDSVCPVKRMRQQETGERYPPSFVVRAKDNDILHNSTSGGFISPIADWVFSIDGILIAAAYDANLSVSHHLITSEDRQRMMPLVRGSKYVQSTMGDCYSKAEEKLKEGKTICFVGTTCQVFGLASYLRKDYPHLYMVDLVCHGSPSPKLWRKYLAYQAERHGSRPVKAAFRNKTYGYHSHTMMLEFDNGKKYFASGRTDIMMRCFMGEIASRPICYECPFKTMNRPSDFTIYDCWHASQLVPGLKDDDRGYTNVIVHTENGHKLLNELAGNYKIYPADTACAVQLDGKMVLKSAIPHMMRKDFFVNLEKENLLEHVNRYLPIKKSDYLIERAKKYLYRTGLLQILKKVKQHMR